MVLVSPSVGVDEGGVLVLASVPGSRAQVNCLVRFHARDMDRLQVVERVARW